MKTSVIIASTALGIAFFSLSSMISGSEIGKQKWHQMDPDYPVNTFIGFKNFNVLMTKYQVGNDSLDLQFVEADTLDLFELYDQDWSKGIIQLSSENPADVFEVSFGWNEMISEFYIEPDITPKSLSSENEDLESLRMDEQARRDHFERWDKNHIELQFLKFKKAKKVAPNTYKLSPLKYEDLKKTMKKAMHLRDTTFYLDGEYPGNVDAVIYQNKVCSYFILEGYIQIKRFSKAALQEVKIIKVEFFTGC